MNHIQHVIAINALIRQKTGDLIGEKSESLHYNNMSRRSEAAMLTKLQAAFDQCLESIRHNPKLFITLKNNISQKTWKKFLESPYGACEANLYLKSFLPLFLGVPKEELYAGAVDEVTAPNGKRYKNWPDQFAKKFPDLWKSLCNAYRIHHDLSSISPNSAKVYFWIVEQVAQKKGITHVSSKKVLKDLLLDRLLPRSQKYMAYMNILRSLAGLPSPPAGSKPSHPVPRESSPL